MVDLENGSVDSVAQLVQVHGSPTVSVEEFVNRPLPSVAQRAGHPRGGPLPRGRTQASFACQSRPYGSPMSSERERTGG
jgi:hypothetical protein